MKPRPALTAVALACLALTACNGADADSTPTASPNPASTATADTASSDEPPGSSAVDDAVAGVEDLVDDAADSNDAADETTDALDHITSCDQVAALTQGLTDELVLTEDSGIDEYGVWCSWDDPEPEDFASIRSVEVIGEPYDQTGAILTPSQLASVNLEHIPDAAIELAGGVAYADSAQTSVATAMSVGVTVPDARISVAGAGWGRDPHVSRELAVTIAKAMLRL